MSTVTYKAPLEGGLFEERNGDVCIIEIGAHKVKFVLQAEPGLSVPSLVHYASGMIVVHANSISVERSSLCMRNHIKISNRSAAEHCLRRIENRVGSEELLAKLNAAPTLNH